MTKSTSPNHRILNTLLVLGLAGLTLDVAPAAAQQVPPLFDESNPAPDAVVELETVVVTGTGTPQKIKETAVRTQVFESSEIQQLQVVRFSDAIDYNPGLRVESTCQNCNASSIQMLGLEQRYISILQDSLPNFTGLAGVYGIDQIPTALIERIEVVKGGGSALYGPNAVAGVINIIPKEPAFTGGEVAMNYTFLDGQTGAGEPGGSAVVHLVTDDATLGVSLFGVRTFVAPVDVTGDGFTEISRQSLWFGGARAFWKPVEDGKLVLDYSLGHEDRRGGSADLSSPPNQVELAEEIFSLRQLFTGTWTQTLNDHWDYRISYSLSDLSRDSYYGGTVPLGQRGDPGWTPDLGFGLTENRLHLIDSLLNYRPAEGHILSLGLQYRNEFIRDRQSAVTRTLFARYENLGVMLQHDVSLGRQWNLVYGTRLDHHSAVPDPVWSPRLAVRWAPSERFRIRGGVATGFRAPEIFDEDLHIENIGGDLQIVTLDPDLREERSLTFSLAPEWEINDRIRVETSLFHARLNRTFINVPGQEATTDNVLNFTKINGSSSDIYGGEFTLFTDFHPFTLDVSYTEQRGRFAEGQLLLGELGNPVDNPILTNRSTRLPDRFATARLAYDAGWAELFATCRWTGPMLVPHIVSGENGELLRNELTRTPNFFVIDIGLSKRFELGNQQTLTATIGVKNLFDTYQSDLDTGAFRDATYVYGPRLPRMFQVGLKYEF